jgi:GNAT superfamily N-acetyltransferase
MGTIREYLGPRSWLRSSFELAEDSSQELDGYLDDGRVLVVADGDDILGHLQLTPTTVPGELEIRNMAVADHAQRRGLGRELVEAAIELARRDGCSRVLVATAASDIGNLRFYQRVGFRMLSIERDAFTPATGYKDGLEIDGIPLRDRVWLDLALPSASGEIRASGRLTWEQHAIAQQLDDEIVAFNLEATGIRDFSELLIAETDDHGAVAAGIYGWSWGRTCWIDALWVRGDRRGQDVGSRLLTAAEEEARARRCTQVALHTHSFQAPAFYERHGFEIVGTLDGDPEGHTELLLRKRLEA